MRITSAGNIGINRSNPTRTLHISSDDDLTSFTGTSYGTVAIENSQYDSGDYNAIDFTYSGSNNPVSRIATKITGSGSSLHFGTSNNYASGITNEALSIDSSGNVTIKDAKQLLFENDAQNASSAILNLGASGTSNLVFATGGAEKLRITSDGKVGISEDDPQEILHIDNGASSTIMLGNTTHGYKLRANVTSSNDYGLMIEDEDGVDLYRAVASTGSSNANTHTWWTAGTERLRIDSVGSALFTNGLQIGVDEGSSTSGGLLIHRYSNTNLNDGVDFDLTITWPHSNVGVFMIECFSGHSHYQGNPMYYKVVGMYGGSSAGTGGIRMTSIQETNTNSLSFSDTSNATQRGNSSNYSITITGRTGLSDTGTSLKSHVHVYVHSRIAPVSVTIS